MAHSRPTTGASRAQSTCSAARQSMPTRCVNTASLSIPTPRRPTRVQSSAQARLSSARHVHRAWHRPDHPDAHLLGFALDAAR
eukprot:6383314-Prymnesium_polylepis.1